MGQTIEDIRGYIYRSPVSWPNEWEEEYLETIRNSIESHRDVSHYVKRLEISRKGFQTYWGSFENTDERILFKVHQAQIRWYIEHLMSTEFPSEKEIQKLRDQYTDIWNYAANSLLKQFQFLDPNAVQKTK